jgi:hypothetical protein
MVSFVGQIGGNRLMISFVGQIDENRLMVMFKEADC